MTRTFGRFVEHDPRSRMFAAPTPPTKRSVLWAHHGPVLDQGEMGSCTGSAAAQLINTDLFAAVRPKGYLTQNDAIKLYARATMLDDAPGTFPPDDTGSSGLAVAKAGVQMKYFGAYKHAFGFDKFCAVLQTSPLLVGTNWYTSMNKTSTTGLVTVRGQLEGGHQWLAIGVDYERQQITGLNSWGPTWGKNGRFFLSFTTMRRLLAEQGDAVAPTPAVKRTLLSFILPKKVTP
jgi:hypothetical protein